MQKEQPGAPLFPQSPGRTPTPAVASSRSRHFRFVDRSLGELRLPDGQKLKIDGPGARLGQRPIWPVNV